MLVFGILVGCFRGIAGGGGVLGCPWPPLARPSFEQTTYNIQVAKTSWQYLGCKSHCWKAHFFKICFFVKYFRQRLLSLVNMGLHAAIIRLSPLIHEGEQRYKASVTPPLKNPALRPCVCIIIDAFTAKLDGIFWWPPFTPRTVLLAPPLKPYFFHGPP